MPNTNGHGPKTAILYSRVSTDEQARSGYSLAQQLEALRDYAEREGYEVIEEVTDPGQSGASLERPGMDRVRDLVAGGGVSVVLAQDRDRFSREPAYLYLLKQEFAERGTALKSLNDRGDESPEGELTDGILDQLAKFERAKTAERTRRGKKRKAKEGKLVAAARPAYGFRYNEARDGYEINEETMPVARRIFRMLAVEGASVNGVKRTLNRERVPTPSNTVWWNKNGGYGWNNKSLKDMIFRDAYRVHTFEEVRRLVGEDVARSLDPSKRYGISWWGQKRVTTRQAAYTKPDGSRGYRRKHKATLKPKSEWIAIPVPDCGIPPEWVDTARERIASYKKPSAAGDRFWDLSGGMLVCGCCGWVMVANRRRKNKDSHYYAYYRCNRKRYHGADGCSMPRSLRAEEVEAEVWAWVKEMLLDPERLRAGLKRLIEEERKAARGNPKERLAVCLEQISVLAGQRQRAQDLAIEGLLSPEELKERLDGIEGQRRALEQEAESLRASEERLADLERDAEALLEQYAQAVPESLDKLSKEERRRVYEMLRLKFTARADGTLKAAGVFRATVLCHERSLSGAG